MSSVVKGVSQPELAGVIGFFDDQHELVEAMKRVRDARYQSFDAFTPHPVHGLEAAQGLKRSWIPFVTLGAGLVGFCCAFSLEYWTSAVDWPLIVGGKPFNSWPAFVPIMFELTVLLGGLCTVAAMFIANRLPNVSKRIFDPSITRDRFVIVIEAPPKVDPDEEVSERARREASQYKPFSESEASDFLKKLGAKDVRSVRAEGWF